MARRACFKWRQAAPAAAATSAAKSSDFFSMPSPTTYSANWLIEALCSWSIWATDCLSFLTNGCDKSVTSLRNFWMEPSTIRSEEHTSELQSLMRISYAVFCLKKKTTSHQHIHQQIQHTLIS